MKEGHFKFEVGQDVRMFSTAKGKVVERYDPIDPRYYVECDIGFKGLVKVMFKESELSEIT